MKSKFVLLSALGLLSLSSCKDQEITQIDCPNGIISFSAQVQPILNQNCNTMGCHGFNNEAPFQLITHQQVDSAVVFGNLLLSIKHQTPTPMPRIDPLIPDAYMLPDSIIQIIECWINQGRQNN
jgi:hypothetical protein